MKKHPPQTRSQDSVARILRAATELFAEHGYYGVTTRQIAAAAGLNIATVHHHVGTKRALYERVYRTLSQQDEQFIETVEALFAESAITDVASLERMVGRLVDRFVDYAGEEPVRARLYLRHWLASDPQFIAFEADRFLAMYKKVRDLLAKARRAGLTRPRVDLGLVLRSIDWMVYSYFVAGAFDWKTWRADPRDPKNLRAFKKALRVYLSCMLGLRQDAR